MIQQLIVSVFLGLFLVHSITLSASTLPDIGRYELSEDDEFAIGRNWLYQSRNKLPILTNTPILQEYIDQLVYEMTAYSDLTDVTYETALVYDKQINAFAVPGGVLGVHLGLIQSVRREDELASVIAHELGHLSQKHYAELVTKQHSSSRQTLGAFIAGIGLLLAGLPAHGMATIAGTIALSAESTIKSVRLNESEADNIGFEVMVKSGRDPLAIVTMFERLLRNSGDGELPLIFRTHPLTQDRISQARARARNANSQFHSIDSQISSQRSEFDFFLAQVLTRIQLTSNYEDLISLVQAEVKVTERLDEKSGLEFGLSELYLLTERPADAMSLLAGLKKVHPLNTFIHSQLARAEYQLGKVEEAEFRLQRLLKISPNNYTLSFTLARLYMHQNKHNQALQVLEAMSISRPGDLWVWGKLEDQYGLLDQPARVHYVRAERNFLYGRYHAALSQLAYADAKNKDRLLKYRIQRRTKEIERFINNLERLL